MGRFYVALLGWLPLPLQVVCTGIVAAFFILTILHAVCFLLDLIPFVR